MNPEEATTVPHTHRPAGAGPFTVATDGACLGNPGPTGWGWVGQDGTWECGALAHATNNVGELLGLIQALTRHLAVPDLRIEADSKYAINTYSSWMDGWAKNGWRSSSGKPVANQHLVAELIHLRDERAGAGLPPVKLKWVRGHSGARLNSWADNRASLAAHAAGTRSGEIWGHEDEGHLDVSIAPPKSEEDRPERSGRKGSFKRSNNTGFGNQTALGARLGLSAIQVGHRLTTAGLRHADTRLPTPRALDLGLVKMRTTSTGQAYATWHLDRTTELIRERPTG